MKKIMKEEREKIKKNFKKSHLMAKKNLIRGHSFMTPTRKV